jgi:polyhydroxyalkanoate synthesis regulator phasin
MSGISNILAIDSDAILRAVRDANQGLIDPHKELHSRCEKLSNILSTSEQVDEAKNLADELKKDAARWQRARLADTKPLKALLDKIESFFKEAETASKTARASVVSSLDALRQAVRAQDASLSASEAVIVNSETGEVLAQISSPTETRKVIESIPTTWDVVAVDRHALDLEALRGCFTDYQLLMAARKHLEVYGNRNLHGATYEQQVSL